MGTTVMLAARRAFAAVLAIVAVVGGYAAVRTLQALQPAPSRPAWAETAWPFASDLWGRGRSFRCASGICGSGIDLYVRAKIGFCNCASAIDDEEVDRVADFDLVGGKHAAFGTGQPIGMHGMVGRSRRYVLGMPGAKRKSAIAIALHDRCDMVVATAVFADDDPAAYETAVIAFLNTEEVRHWAEVTLGL